jgi:hypothetical protein
MTPADLTAWMYRLRLNKAGASSALGLARSTLDRYLSGEVTIPKYIDLACRYLEGQTK